MCHYRVQSGRVWAEWAAASGQRGKEAWENDHRVVEPYHVQTPSTEGFYKDEGT